MCFYGRLELLDTGELGPLSDAAAASRLSRAGDELLALLACLMRVVTLAGVIEGIGVAALSPSPISSTRSAGLEASGSDSTREIGAAAFRAPLCTCGVTGALSAGGAGDDLFSALSLPILVGTPGRFGIDGTTIARTGDNVALPAESDRGFSGMG